MQFHSLDYLLFLVVVVGLYWALARFARLRLLIGFVASCLFYMAWNPYYIGLILGSTLVDYTAGLQIHRARVQAVRRFWLVLSLVVNLGLLATFKYFNFFAEAAAEALALTGLQVSAPTLDVLLPVGISFYTFQTLSYTIDIYRGRLEPTRDLIRFGFYVTFFPQLVAGPIVRASELLPQLSKAPRLTEQQVGEGVFLIATGMFKKILVADFLAINLVDRVFDDPTGYSALEVLVGLYAYTMQIYCDFSGYTDVARGSAALFGLRLPENFDRPYKAVSVADFWRRWHMTLSTWLRDYLYFPLGGSRAGPVRAYWNLWITMFLVGLWHGAGWTFVIYGALQASVMVGHRYLQRRRSGPPPPATRWRHVRSVFLTLQFVVLSRIFFRAPDMDSATEVMARLGTLGMSLGHINNEVWLVLIGSFAVHYLPERGFAQLQLRFVRLPALAQGVCLVAVAGVLMQLVSSDVVPYIYFQF